MKEKKFIKIINKNLIDYGREEAKIKDTDRLLKIKSKDERYRPIASADELATHAFYIKNYFRNNKKKNKIEFI